MLWFWEYASAYTVANPATAIAAFRRDGFAVLSDVLTADEADELYEIVKKKADEVVQRHDDGTYTTDMMHGPVRYSYDEYGHNPEWEYLGHNERVLPILRGVWEGHDFRAVAAGGDFVLPGGEMQPLHNDLAWKGAGEKVPRVVSVNYYVRDVLPTSGPIRIVPGSARFPVPPHRVIRRFEPEWMTKSTITGRQGYAVIRDLRVWHGGTSNTSDAPRYMPNLEYVLADAPYADIESTATLEQVDPAASSPSSPTPPDPDRRKPGRTPPGFVTWLAVGVSHRRCPGRGSGGQEVVLSPVGGPGRG